MSNTLTSWIRTVVPGLWAALITLLVVHGLLPASVANAAGHLADTVLVPVILAGLYAGLRWLESQPWMPAWLTALLLGSTRTPQYTPPVSPTPPAGT